MIAAIKYFNGRWKIDNKFAMLPYMVFTLYRRQYKRLYETRRIHTTSCRLQPVVQPEPAGTESLKNQNLWVYVAQVYYTPDAHPVIQQSINQREICRAPLYDTSRSTSQSKHDQKVHS